MRNWTLSSRTPTGHHQHAPGVFKNTLDQYLGQGFLSGKKNILAARAVAHGLRPTSWRTASLWRRGYHSRQPRPIALSSHHQLSWRLHFQTSKRTVRVRPSSPSTIAKNSPRRTTLVAREDATDRKTEPKSVVGRDGLMLMQRRRCKVDTVIYAKYLNAGRGGVHIAVAAHMFRCAGSMRRTISFPFLMCWL